MVVVLWRRETEAEAVVTHVRLFLEQLSAVGVLAVLLLAYDMFLDPIALLASRISIVLGVT